MKEDYDRAMADYTEAIRVDPTYVLAFKNRGSVYQRQDDLDRAIANYSEAARLDPTFLLAFADRASAYQEKGDFDNAIADFGTVIRLSPKDAKAYYSRGVAYQLSGDFDCALDDYDQTIVLNPNNLFAFNNRGVIHRIKGDIDRAIADYDAAIHLNPDEATFYYNRGSAKVFAGSSGEALVDFKRAAALKPKSAYVALWIDILAHRDHLPRELAAHATQLDMGGWPAPIVRLYLGQATQDDVIDADDDRDKKVKTEKLCTAYFLAANWPWAAVHRRKGRACCVSRSRTARETRSLARTRSANSKRWGKCPRYRASHPKTVIRNETALGCAMSPFQVEYLESWARTDDQNRCGATFDRMSA